MKRKYHLLPEIYEIYLNYYAKSRQVRSICITNVRRVLSVFHDYLEKSKVTVSGITIEHIDAFLSEQLSRFAPTTQRHYRSYLRQFLKYLYQERGILDRDLSPLLGKGPSIAQAIPPKFLRPHELKRLFNRVDFSSPRDFRTHAILHLAYTLGLLPREICMITLDDICFRQSEINLPYRRNISHFRLPLSEDTVKAIAAYIVGARPPSNDRALFSKLRAPYGPISPSNVSHDLSCLMRKANLTSSTYWLRHTYARNLLERGASFFEIKEILGHDRIQSAKRYLQIHTKLMRRVLFNETL